ncbi:MAG: beta-glucuronidase [Tannerellaceae bacterium]|nr:beta-glucuronidase [Tannerellaceae bacterium]
MKITNLLYTLLLVLACLPETVYASSQPRPEYPRPQFERTAWVNLNGDWTYEIDYTLTGISRENPQSKGFGQTIRVPFAPESQLSGVQHTNFIPSIWYHRTLQLPAGWEGKKIVLNFGAIYYESEIYLDGQLIARHFGGSDSFGVDVTEFLTAGTIHQLVVQAKSDLRSGFQGAGKQSLELNSYGCNYTRTTGIWQTVWMEAVAADGLERVTIIPDIDQKVLLVTPAFYAINNGNTFTVTVKENGKVVSRASAKAAQGIPVALPVKNLRLWSPESPFLYDIELEVLDKTGKSIDKVTSYAGMRKIHIEGNKIYLNNQPYYQRLVLDQGFYPDGIWTAPSDEALKRDIELSKAAGFNGARLHQKVFEERFHYWADKIGYLTWGESASWGMDANHPLTARNFITEWSNVVVRDRNHPSIVTWTAMNEQWWPENSQYPRLVDDLYTITRQLDPTRPVNTVSGGVHVKTDIWTVHNYEQDGEKLKNELFNGSTFQQTPNFLQNEFVGNFGFNKPKREDLFNYKEYTGGIPYIIDEFGGIRCEETQPQDNSWGYGESPKTREEFYQRLEAQVDALLSIADQVWGFCYTQLTDVEQEQNGIYFYDRSAKFDMERIRAIFSKPIK